MPYRKTAKLLRIKKIRRRSILQTAVALFGQRGYHAATVPAIVQAAHCGIGSFYRYFRNKEDVFAAALQCFGDTVTRALRNAIATSTDPRRQLQSATERLVLHLISSRFGVRILLVESSGLGARIDPLRREIVASQARFFEQILAQMPSPPDPSYTSLTARCCVGSIYESVRLWLELPVTQRPSVHQLATTVSAFVLHGLSNDLQCHGAPPSRI